MNVVQTGESSALIRQKQQLRDTAAKDEARADQLSRAADKDLFTASQKKEDAAENREQAEALSKQSKRLRRNGREQSRRGLERIADGSDRTSEGFVGTEKGLSELKGSLSELQDASAAKSQALDTAKSGLAEQAVENSIQAAQVANFSQLNEQDARLDIDKAHQVSGLADNVAQRQQGLGRQSGQIDSFLLAGESFSQGTAIKSEGFEHLRTAGQHSVRAEALGDAREGKKLTQSWAEAERLRHEETSTDLKFSSVWHALKAQAASLQAQHLQRVAAEDSATADGMAARAAGLKTEAATLLRQARCLEQSGQCHIAIGRQMQCCPWTYCQGVILERQGCAEVAEAQRMKEQAKEKRAEGQQLAVEAEKLRAQAEDAQSRGEEFEVKSEGERSRSSFLQSRAGEHAEQGERAGETAERAGARAEALGQAAQKAKTTAQEFRGAGLAKLEEGFEHQDEALSQQAQAEQGFRYELGLEGKASSQADEIAGEAQATIAQEFSLLGRSGRLLHRAGKSLGREAQAQAKVSEGIAGLESGLALSETAQERGVEATRMLEEARELELEGLRLQNRGQKMLLEARPKLAQSAKLSAEAFDASQAAESQDEEAARLIESGNQKLAAAKILREKAASYRQIAAE